ncbi:hypothetical protein TNCV_3898401 [Trichonephila clavipes]|nr:hypothetical protein TNCV_3898401 [Trichonephila clavipes]
MTGRIKIMKALGFKIGHFTVTSAFKANYARIKNAEIKSKSYTLEARRASRMRKKATNEHFAELEGRSSTFHGVCVRVICSLSSKAGKVVLTKPVAEDRLPPSVRKLITKDRRLTVSMIAEASI